MRDTVLMSWLRRAPGRALRGVVIAAFLAGATVLISPSAAIACSCATLTPEQYTKNADTVGTGTVEWTSTNGIDRTYSVAFEQVFKGVAGMREKLVTPADGAACGLDNLVADQRYIFFIDGKHPGQMKINLCGGTTAYDTEVLDAVQSVTGTDAFPPFPSTDSGPTVSDDDPDPIRYIGIGAFVIAGIAVVVVLARRRVRGGGSRQYLG